MHVASRDFGKPMGLSRTLHVAAYSAFQTGCAEVLVARALLRGARNKRATYRQTFG